MHLYIPNPLLGDVSQSYVFTALVSDIQLSRRSYAAGSAGMSPAGGEGNNIDNHLFSSITYKYSLRIIK